MSERRLWEYRWFRDAILLAVVVLVLLLAWEVRAILFPVAVGLVLAYLCNPLVTWLHERAFRRRVPRWTGTMLVIVVLLALVAGLGVYVVPKMLGQAGTLASSLPRYAQKMAHQVEQAIARSQERGIFGFGAQTQPATQPAISNAKALPGAQPSTVAEMLNAGLGQLDPGEVGRLVARWLGVGVGLVGSAVNVTIYLIIALTVAGVCFFYFSWRYPDILAWGQQFIPSSRRQGAGEVLAKMDRTVSAWFRGRLLQAFIFAVILSVGWGVVGVPYWLLLGMVGGVLALVPYLASVSLPVAVLLVWIDSLARGIPLSPWAILLWPTVVYAIAQLLDGWVVEPLVQGKAANLNPLSVLLAVLIGGTLAGAMGLILAIPVTACLKILWTDVAQPRLVAWAKSH